MAAEKCYTVYDHSFNANILTINLLVLGFHKKKLRTTLGGHIKDSVTEFSEGEARWSTSEVLWERLAKSALSKVKKDKRYSKRIAATVDEAGAEMQRIYKEFVKVDIEKATSQKMLNYYKKIIHAQENLGLAVIAVKLLDPAGSPFADFLKDQIKRQKRRHLRQGTIEEQYTALVRPDAAESLIRKETKSMHRLAIAVCKQKELYRKLHFLRIDDINTVLNKKYKKIYKLLETHAHSFKWVQYGFQGPSFDKYHYLMGLKKMVMGCHPKDELARIEEREDKARKRQKALEKELRLSAQQEDLFAAARELSHLKEYAQQLFYLSFYMVDKMLWELSRRHSLSHQQVRNCTMPEVERMLTKEEHPDPAVLDRRQDGCVLLIEDEKGSVLYDKEARAALRDRGFKTKPLRQAKIVQGTTAYQGMVKGRAKVIRSPADLEKIEEGDIVICQATTPEYLPYLRRAAAFVTDSDGLQCHTALMAKDLKKPCIIAAQNATQIFADDDLVEVHGEQGFVKKA
ncbi:hypothetical protein JXB02_02735 [Candidatus Woesearchaeota archaeon]|nr:hypothetical protein [Candidatus Woesearchaeota archaeon]